MKFYTQREEVERIGEEKKSWFVDQDPQVFKRSAEIAESIQRGLDVPPALPGRGKRGIRHD